MTLACIALAAAIWLGVDRAGSPAAGPRLPRGAATSSPLRSPLLAGLVVAVVAVALTGPIAGLIAAAILAPATVALLGRWQARQRARPPEAELAWLPLVLDLTGAGLLAGQPLDVALAAAAPVQLRWLGERLRQVSAMLRLGAEPAQAWSAVAAEPRLQPVALTAIRSSTSGIRLAGSLADLATELRAAAHAAALARAQRAGVWVIAPLGLCFLPAFVCLGIVPVVIGLAETLRH